MFNRDFDGMIQEISVKEFRSTGLLLVVNQILHLFGFAIVVDEGDNRMYPAFCKFRGFDEKSIINSCDKIYKYLEDNLEEIKKDLD